MKLIFIFLPFVLLYSCQTSNEQRQEKSSNKVELTAEINPQAILLNDSAVSVMSSKSQEAIRLLDEAIALQPNYFSAWHNKVNCQMHLGLIEDAIVSLLKMEEIDPNYPDNKTNLGIMYDIKGDSLLALEKYQEVEKMYVGILDTVQTQDNPYQMYELLRASNLILMGEKEKASGYLKKLLSNPSVDTVYTSKAAKDLLGVNRQEMLEGFKKNFGKY